MFRILICTVALLFLIGCESDDSGVNPAPSVVTTITMLTPVVESCEPVCFIVEVTNVSDEPVMIEYCLCDGDTHTVTYQITQLTGEEASPGSITPADPPCMCKLPLPEFVLESQESIADTVLIETTYLCIKGICCWPSGIYMINAGPIDKRYPRDAVRFDILP